MKNILTIAAIAVLTVFAVSCSPDVSTTGINYEERNVNNRPENIGDNIFSQVRPSGFSNALNTIAPEKVNPRITFTIPAAADIHKDFTEAKLKEFLSFFEYTNSTDSSVINKGLASTQAAIISYKLVTRAGENVTVELDKTFPSASASYSNVVAKIDSTKYTYLSGIKLDRDNDGIEGVADYDDHFEQINVTSSNFSDFSGPRQVDWYVDLNSTRVGPIASDWTGTSALSAPVTLRLTQPFSLSNFINISIANAEGRAIFKEIGEKVAAGMMLQKLVGGDTWTDVKTAVYEASADGVVPNTNDALLFKDVIFDHRVLYRVAWNGGKIITDGLHFGVKQKVYVTGAWSNIDIVKTTDRFNRTYVRSAGFSFENGNIPLSEVENFNDLNNLGLGTNAYGITYTALAANNGRVRVRIEVPIRGNNPTPTTADPHVALAAINLDDFKKSFKFAFRRGTTPLSSVADLFDNDDVVEINVDHFRLAREGDMLDPANPSGPRIANTMTNVIYVYLDPNFNIDPAKYNNGDYKIFMNSGIKYAKGPDSTSPERVFGDWTQYRYGGFRMYN